MRAAVNIGQARAVKLEGVDEVAIALDTEAARLSTKAWPKLQVCINLHACVDFDNQFEVWAPNLWGWILAANLKSKHQG